MTTTVILQQQKANLVSKQLLLLLRTTCARWWSNNVPSPTRAKTSSLMRYWWGLTAYFENISEVWYIKHEQHEWMNRQVLTLWTQAAALPATIQTSIYLSGQIFLQADQGGGVESPRSSGLKGLIMKVTFCSKKRERIWQISHLAGFVTCFLYLCHCRCALSFVCFTYV